MTNEMFKKALKAVEDGKYVAIGFHLHGGIKTLQEAFGGLDHFIDFLEDIECAEEPTFQKETAQ